MSTATTTAKAKPLVLIAEDDPTLAKMVARLLSEFAETLVCVDGVEALSRIQDLAQPTPRLIITDVMMPGIDGLELVRRLGADSRLSSIPVIMLTAKNTPMDVIAGINSGVRHYVTKPFKQDDLLTKVKKALSL